MEMEQNDGDLFVIYVHFHFVLLCNFVLFITGYCLEWDFVRDRKSGVKT